MSYPKIVYNSVTLSPSYPPRQVPNYDAGVVRHINVASSGKTEQIYERTDTFLEVNFDSVQDGDAAAWQAFFAWANQGKTFDYYPDASLSDFTTYTLETLRAKLSYKSPGMWSAGNLTFRKYV